MLEQIKELIMNYVKYQLKKSQKIQNLLTTSDLIHMTL